MLKVWLLVFALVTQECAFQEQDGPYRGKFIGAINTYHHQVSGEVYAVDDWTLLLVNFNYDGTGDDTFFWAGDAVRPGPQGFIVPDEHGKTNILERYINQDIRLTLPEGKRVSRLKWFCVYDIDSQNSFGDVYVPDEFEPPAPRTLPALAGAVSSAPLQVLTATTLLIPEFKYDGSGEEVYFWTGVGPQPSGKGMKIPDEYGYLEPLHAYKSEDVTLELAGGLTVFDINWIAVYDVGARRSLGTVLVPEGLNVPPSPTATHSYESKMPSCKQLHRDYQVSWEVFGPQVTFELAAQISLDEYLAWGVSGSSDGSQMVGADVAVAHYSAPLRQAFVHDYNISAQAPCVQVLDRRVGVCRDDALGGVNSYQLFMSRREDGLTIITFRRSLKPDEPMDLEWSPDVPQFAVWAVGRLDHALEPSFHRLYHKQDLKVDLKQPAALNDCFKFTVGSRTAPPAWETAQLFDPALRVYRFTLGPSGGERGIAGRGGAGGHRAPAPLAWYVNGQLAPDLQLRRGLQYSFQVSGGNNPHSATEYHPLIVTGEADGGLERLSEAAQRSVRVYAGVHYTRRGRLSPTAAGGLCLGSAAAADRRRDAAYATFRAYNRTLSWRCDAAPAALLVAPNSSWPDRVYYHSFTHSGMGGRIFIVDRHKRNLGRRGAEPGAAAGAARAPHSPLLLLLLLAAATLPIFLYLQST